eukprot:TRINITY_DN299_c0_g1_i1.p1 TRINITY_DN299_c0_g1~~TRINITY_DN299_c0_g1_i1.p1  ORF type:complete len:454 (-),score=110.70 TRINITY_DN299_c0_g1_i1:166-1467(-)
MVFGGLLAKAEKYVNKTFQTRNKIYVRTDKGEYYAGETVYGTVFLLIEDPIESEGLSVQIKGKEKCSWKQTVQHPVPGSDPPQHTSETVTLADDRECFSRKAKLIVQRGTFPQGKFAYHFALALPDDLPGVYSKQKKGLGWYGKVSYRVKAEVDCPGIATDLQTKQGIVIHQKVRRAAAVHEKQQEITTCCCVKQGAVEVKAWVDRQAYLPDDTVLLTVSVKNGTDKKIDHVKADVIREIELQVKNNTRGDVSSKLEMRSVMASSKQDGNLEGQGERQYAFKLPLRSKKGRECKPTTDGKLVECEYVIALEVDVAWASDLNARIPLHITAPPNTAFSQWQPQDWFAQCVVCPSDPSVLPPPEVVQKMMGDAGGGGGGGQCWLVSAPPPPPVWTQQPFNPFGGPPPPVGVPPPFQSMPNTGGDGGLGAPLLANQ